MTPLAWRRPSANRATVTILPPVAGEEGFRLAQALLGQQHVSAQAQGQGAPAEAADAVAEVVPEHRGGEADQPDRYHVQASGPGVDGGGDQDGLARGGHPEILDEQQEPHREIPPVVQQRGESGEESGQLHGRAHRAWVSWRTVERSR
jgi:hypothetical protein